MTLTLLAIGFVIFAAYFSIRMRYLRSLRTQFPKSLGIEDVFVQIFALEKIRGEWHAQLLFCRGAIETLQQKKAGLICDLIFEGVNGAFGFAFAGIKGKQVLEMFESLKVKIPDLGNNLEDAFNNKLRFAIWTEEWNNARLCLQYGYQKEDFPDECMKRAYETISMMIAIAGPHDSLKALKKNASAKCNEPLLIQYFSKGGKLEYSCTLDILKELHNKMIKGGDEYSEILAVDIVKMENGPNVKNNMPVGLLKIHSPAYALLKAMA